ncbi:LuxR C-terminal-related transcriptional regulator [Pseudogracilibacillus auburnensis]|uniref:Two-component system response regulator DegU n=1 Tax=Pseudogracilibacillus auburnensis TaxID=1494959 RepID=A0A2V3VTV1_9BACI|nr:response regulator transcription factor [Pseudogracilibacillus auburnensis]PXW85343.1 two-component system response regulator DegU [Pseudogracilibacillus auburnensis]
MSETKINIVLIDHQQLFREGVKRVLDSESSFHIIVSSDDYSVVKTILPLQDIDVLLIDVNTFMQHRYEIKEEVFHNDSNIKVIILSAEGEENYVTEAIKIGVHGYLLKEMDIFSFIEAIKIVKNGVSYIHPTITHDLVEEYRKLTSNDLEEEEENFQMPLHLYTKRECQVLQLLTNGQSNRQIAETLNISEKTVKNHVSSLFKKMNVNDRTQAVVMAIRKHWVEL